MPDPRISVRVSEMIKEEMEKHPEVNWSEIIRRCLHQHLQEITGSGNEAFLSLLQSYSKDIKQLWALHMYLTIFPYEPLERSYLMKTAKLLLGKDGEGIIGKVEEDLKRIFPNINYETREKALEIFENSEFIEPIYKETVKRVSSASTEIKLGVWLLTEFLDGDYYSSSLCPQGLERTFKILTNNGEDIQIIDELVHLGLLYGDYYESRAYSHPTYIVPGYAQDLLSLISAQPLKFGIYSWKPEKYRVISMIKEDPRVIEFLKWMGGNTRYIEAYNEEEIIKEDLRSKELNLKYDDFVEVRRNLISEGLLVIDYFPHRRRAGRRSSSPAMWIYRIPSKGLAMIGEAMVEILAKR